MEATELNLKTRLKGLQAFRLAFLTVMAGSGTILHYRYDEPVSTELQRLLISGFSVAIALWLVSRALPEKWMKGFAWTQIAWDLTYTALLANYTGGLLSAFWMLFGVQQFLAAFAIGSRGAAVSATGSLLALIIVTASQWGRDLFHDPHLISRFLFSGSLLLLFGSGIAILFRHRERLQKRYEDLTQLHSAIIDHISSGIVYVDENDEIRLMNRSALKIIEEDLTGQKLLASPLAPAYQKEGREEVEITLSPDRKKILGFHWTVLPGLGSLLAFQDLSLIKKLETKVRNQEKLASVGQLAAGIAHEIRNPLASLSGSIQLMKAEMRAGEGSEKLMTIVLRETDRLDRLLQNFLTYAKPGSLQVQDVVLKKIFEEILSLYKNSKDYQERQVEIVNKVEANLVCRCDPNYLKQILWNLLRNAVDAVEGSGKIVLEAREELPWILFSITDSGPGIPSEILPKIFDPFFTTKSGGTGLGLALVFQMVKAHGGRVWAENREHGAQFQFELLKGGPSESVEYAA